MSSAKPTTRLPANTRRRVDVAIVGAGFSGLGLAMRLKRAGESDFVVIEKNDDVGGTWLVNTYPGCACDVQSHLYSFSFEQNPDWSRTFASQPEILRYLRHCAQRDGLREHLRLGTAVERARWDQDQGHWELPLSSGETIHARVLVSAVGGLSRPVIPELPGLADFQGQAFHTQQWRHDLDLTGKQVAVVGTGASAVQLVPAIAPQVGQLDLYQRSAAWILPKPDRPVGLTERLLYRGSRRALDAQRARLYLTAEARALAMVDNPRLMKLAEREAKSWLRRQVPDRALRRKLTPDYPMGCKRVLMSNDYYPALTRPNCELITGGVQRVTPTGLVGGDGIERPADLIVFGTGFDVRNPLGPVPVTGRDGLDLGTSWAGSPRAYLGCTVSGFPNLFVMLGPNTGLGHNSIIYMIESQTAYVMDALKQMRRKRVHSVEVRPEVLRRYIDEMDRRSAGTIWARDCNSWYLDDQGRNFSLWPGYTWQYRQRTRRFRMHDYIPARAPAAAGA